MAKAARAAMMNNVAINENSGTLAVGEGDEDEGEDDDEEEDEDVGDVEEEDVGDVEGEADEVLLVASTVPLMSL